MGVSSRGSRKCTQTFRPKVLFNFFAIREASIPVTYTTAGAIAIAL